MIKVSHLAKLTPKQVREIRKRRSCGEPKSKLAREFKVSESTIYQVAAGNVYKQVA